MSFEEWEDEIASVMDDDKEDDDSEDEDVELILRDAFVADEVFAFCCNDSVDGGWGAGRILMFPLFPIVCGTFTPFFFTAP